MARPLLPAHCERVNRRRLRAVDSSMASEPPALRQLSEHGPLARERHASVVMGVAKEENGHALGGMP
jgi:hypothetical protein